MGSIVARIWRRLWGPQDSPSPWSPYGLRGPAVPHLSLNEKEFRNRRLFIVGDVHGCYDELTKLLNIADATQPNVQVIFVGDLINKGPKNVECVELARRIGALAVRGNHDEVALSVLQKTRAMGGSLPTQMQWLGDLSEESERWLLELPYTIHIPWLNSLVVHAGLVPGTPLCQQSTDHMIHVRNLIWDEARGTYDAISRTDEGRAWAGAWPGPMHVFFGHDARRRLQREAYATGLDTGCVYGGELSGMFIDGDDVRTAEVLSVPAISTHRKP
ncbi:serine/threonine-protein phosphatase 1-like [Sycon ciliatum]|uniref:serine/threonine-protein phosphatase 1-like n=1 Tax=Sycon ciliatum TaxID=27933 RepID=UPI0031F711D2